MMRIVKFFLFIIAITAINCSAKGPETKLSGLRFYSSNRQISQELESRESRSAAENFLLATVYEDDKEYKKALYYYANSAFEKQRTGDIKLYAYPIYKYLKGMHFRSAYYDQAAYKIGTIFFKYKEYDFVVKFSKLVSTDDPSLYFENIKLSMQSYSKLEDYDAALKESDKALSAIDNEGYKKVILIRKASIHQKTKQYLSAKEVYVKVYADDQNSWQAPIAAIQVKKLVTDNGIELSGEEIIDTAAALYSGKKYDDALELFSRLSKNSPLSAERDLILVKLYVKSKRYAEADKLVNSYASNAEQYKQMLLAEADANWPKRQRQAVRLYQKLITEASTTDSERLKRPFERVCRYLYNRSKSAAVSYMLKYIDIYPDTPAAQEFLWLTARSYILKGNYSNALPVLEAITADVKNKYYGNAACWLYRYYRSKGNSDKSEEYFFRTVAYAPNSSYTWLLADELKGDYSIEKLNELFEAALADGDTEKLRFANFMLFIKERNNLKKEARISSIKEAGLYPFEELYTYLDSEVNSVYSDLFRVYFEAGYTAGITSLMDYFDDSEEDRKFLYYIMSNYGKMYENYYYMYLGSARLLSEYKLKEDISLFDTDFSKRLYPQAFKPIVAKAIRRYGVLDEYQIYSVMKAESAFNHKAKSWVSATGLMQIMPATGRGLARQLKIKKYDLKDPATSILFGSSYLSWLSKMYDGRFDRMLGGYNAGPGNMKKWVNKFGTDDAILFAEKVPFYETRNYIFKNQRFYLSYKVLYGVAYD